MSSPSSPHQDYTVSSHLINWDHPLFCSGSISPNLAAEWNSAFPVLTSLTDVLRTILQALLVLRVCWLLSETEVKVAGTKCRRLQFPESYTFLSGMGLLGVFSDSFLEGTMEATWNLISPWILEWSSANQTPWTDLLLSLRMGQVLPVLCYETHTHTHTKTEIFKI